jgi:hypothetical protein
VPRFALAGIPLRGRHGLVELTYLLGETIVLAEVKLVIAPTEARLTITKGDEVVDDEIWSFGRKIGKTEAREFARAVFDDAYDGINFMVHGEE